MISRLPISSVLVTTLLVGWGPGSWGAEVHTLSLDEYTSRAIKGIQARQNSLSFESAGYSREIAFRQTDSPTLTANATGSRTENSGFQTSADSQGVARTDTGQANLSLREPLPTGTVITAETQTTGNQSLGLGTSSGSDQNAFTASVVQPLYIFVKNSVRRTRQQAEISYFNAQDTFDTTVLSLRSQARSFYYSVMQGEESIKVEQRKVDSSKKLLDITQALVQGGKTAPVETMRARITLQQDDRQLQNAIATRAKAVLNAKNFIYLPLDDDIVFSSQLEFRLFPHSLERLVQFSMLHNPSLKSLRRNRDLAQLTFDAAIETTRPTLSLNSSYAYSETHPGFNHNWVLGGTANWLFFDSFVTRDSASIARIGQIVADLNLADGERTTELNVNNTYVDIKNAERQIIDFASSRDQARHNVDIVRLRFKNGLERLIDVFDAENNMRDLDNEYLNLLVSYNQLKDRMSQFIGADVETMK